LSPLYQLGLLIFKFSDFENMSRNENPLTVWRERHTEEDIEELAKDRRMLASLDALSKGIVSFRACIFRILGPSLDRPRDLGVVPLTIVMQEVLDRMKDGRVAVPPGLQDEFPFAYDRDNPSSDQAKAIY
jgi:hypothetical protein